MAHKRLHCYDCASGIPKIKCHVMWVHILLSAAFTAVDRPVTVVNLGGDLQTCLLEGCRLC